MRATVHNIKREQMQEGDVYIGRRGKGMNGYFGNPFSQYDRAHNIQYFEEAARRRIATDPVFKNSVRKLHGKRLFCFCAPLPCHGDVLARLAEELNKEELV